MEVKVFGAKHCAGCVTVKQLLEVNGVEYHYYDVDHHADMEEASSYGVRSIPTVVYTGKDGEHIFTGASKMTIDSMLLHIQGGKV